MNMRNKENSAEDVSDEEVSHNGGPEASRSAVNVMRNRVKNGTGLHLELETVCGNCPKPDLYFCVVATQPGTRHRRVYATFYALTPIYTECICVPTRLGSGDRADRIPL